MLASAAWPTGTPCHAGASSILNMSHIASRQTCFTSQTAARCSPSSVARTVVSLHRLSPGHHVATLPDSIFYTQGFRAKAPRNPRHTLNFRQRLYYLQPDLEKLNSQLVALCVLLGMLDRNNETRTQTCIPLWENSQPFALCVFLRILDRNTKSTSPNVHSLGKTQFATSCVMCFPMDSGPKHRITNATHLSSTSQRKLGRRHSCQCLVSVRLLQPTGAVAAV